MPSPREHAAGRVGALARHREPDDPDLADARRDLRAAEATEHAEYIQRLVDTFPPLSAEQRTKIAALLRPRRARVTAGRARPSSDRWPPAL